MLFAYFRVDIGHSAWNHLHWESVYPRICQTFWTDFILGAKSRIRICASQRPWPISLTHLNSLKGLKGLQTQGGYKVVKGSLGLTYTSLCKGISVTDNPLCLQRASVSWVEMSVETEEGQTALFSYSCGFTWWRWHMKMRMCSMNSSHYLSEHLCQRWRICVGVTCKQRGRGREGGGMKGGREREGDEQVRFIYEIHIWYPFPW